MAYIEQETTIKELEKMPAYFESGDIRYGIIVAIDILKKQTPAADVVEVVRCKDCKYCEVFYPLKEEGEEAIKAHYCKLYNSNRKQIDFCSYGVKKECADQKPVTNFEYFKKNIAKMSIDELAKVIKDSDNCEKFCVFTKDGRCDSRGDADVCEIGVKRYLESEVSE